MKYFLCKADIGEGIPYYSLIIRGQDDTEARLIFAEYVKQDYPDYVKDCGGIKNMDLWVNELTIDYIIDNAFGKII